MNMPLVSVLMTAYNREAYIGEAIESVLSSSFEDFELIITDDCSSDNTVRIAKSYEKKDARVKVFVNDKNLGDYPNRNQAAKYAKGQYLKYLDADDLMYKFSLAYMVEAMQRFPQAALGISYNTPDDIVPYPNLSTPQQTYHAEYLGKSLLRCGPSATIIRKEVFDSVNGFSGRQFLGDHELWLKIAAVHDVVKLQPSLVWWRQHPDQEAAKERKDFSVQNLRFQHSLKVLAESSHFFDAATFQMAQKNFKRAHARMILKKILKEKKLAEGLRLWKLSSLQLSELLGGRPL